MWRAAGLVVPPRAEVAFSEQDLEAVRVLAGAMAVLGDEATLQIARVFGASLARMAEAAFRATLANVDNAYGPESTSPVAAAGAATLTAAMADGAGTVLDVIFRRHLGTIASSSDTLVGPGPEAAEIAVGFADLVGSTGLVVELAPKALAAAMSDLDALSLDVAAAHHGRVVKLIGDAVMFVASEPDDAVALGLELVARLGEHPVLPTARAAVAAGVVTLRDGDHFGPVVNLAARLVHEAAPGVVLVPDALAGALDPSRFTTGAATTHDLRGFAEAVTARPVTLLP